jgi:hypothetical protein
LVRVLVEWIGTSIYITAMGPLGAERIIARAHHLIRRVLGGIPENPTLSGRQDGRSGNGERSREEVGDLRFRVRATLVDPGRIDH